MNKEVINKYWKEFCHWKDGGMLLIYSEGTWYPFNGYKDAPEWNMRPDWLIVINDEYVEYRKALAEGKTIENWNGSKHLDIGKSGANFHNFELHNLRIKPDEPEFKVGDYIITPNHGIRLIHKIDNKNCYYDSVNTANKYKMSELRLWTLESADDDEWVKYWHKNDTIYHGCSVAYFNRFVKDNIDDNYIVVPDIGQTPKKLGLEK